jgi:hypothetical protein
MMPAPSLDNFRKKRPGSNQGLFGIQIQKKLEHQVFRLSKNPTNGYGPTWSINTQACPTTKYERSLVNYRFFHITAMG